MQGVSTRIVHAGQPSLQGGHPAKRRVCRNVDSSAVPTEAHTTTRDQSKAGKSAEAFLPREGSQPYASAARVPQNEVSQGSQAHRQVQEQANSNCNHQEPIAGN